MKYFIITLALTFTSFAQTSLEECAVLAQYHGHATMSQKVPKECYEIIKGLNASMQKTAKHTIAGHKNLLYIESEGLLKLISGNKTLLENVKAIDAAPSDDLIFVLNEKETELEVLSFPVSFGGNLAPRRRLVTNELEGASGLKADTKNKELYVFNKNQSWIKVFNQNADPNGKRAENSNKLLRLITGVSPLDLEIIDTELYILTDREIIVVEKNHEGEADSLRSKDITEYGFPKDIQYNKSEETLELINNTGELFKISL
ncbi:MAG: hypothetical protein CME64_04685 [Halobacteriovoraceae bacterium]|nr:hypothetical protein [Halobacteriovoraceae bacterium]|tara:strand:+ start:229243 stop:230022 length:780 start_codon:yes stop_codon:yes gene_type:complete